MIAFHAHIRTWSLGVLLWLFLASCTSLRGCGSTADEGCSSNTECDEGLVCSSTGECQAPAARYEARRRAFRRFGSDGAAYGLWLRYGTAGTVPPIELQMNTQIDPDSMVEKDVSHVFCSIDDVRTDDLLFNHTSAYPEGYWGASPIADGQSGRCGDDLETLTWRLLNCERITRGLVPVECDLRLVWIGRQHANDMATRDFFGHVNPDGLDAFRRLTGRGILYGLAGENLARQQSIFDAHTAWMGSPLHRRNILTEHYNYAGVGVIRKGRQLILSEAFLGGVQDEAPVEPGAYPDVFSSDNDDVPAPSMQD